MTSYSGKGTGSRASGVSAEHYIFPTVRPRHNEYPLGASQRWGTLTSVNTGHLR